MGHYWREIDHEGAEAHDRACDRAIKLRDQIKSRPLSLFTAGDLLGLLRIMKAEPYAEDFEMGKPTRKR